MYYLALCDPFKSSAIPSRGHVQYYLALCYPSKSSAAHLKATKYIISAIHSELKQLQHSNSANYSKFVLKFVYPQ